MTFEEFEQHVKNNWRTPEGISSLFVMTAGLGGETGEVLEHFKKLVRDNKFDRNAFRLEMGDVLYYWVRMTQWAGMTLDEITDANVRKLARRKKRNNGQA